MCSVAAIFSFALVRNGTFVSMACLRSAFNRGEIGAAEDFPFRDDHQRISPGQRFHRRGGIAQAGFVAVDAAGFLA